MKMIKSFLFNDFWRKQNTRKFQGLSVLKSYLNIFVVPFSDTKQTLGCYLKVDENILSKFFEFIIRWLTYYIMVYTLRESITN
jgi:predicted PolB exonuclease-like 3'-5' exonuclease